MNSHYDDPPAADGVDTHALAAIVRARLFDDVAPYRVGRYTVLERIGAGGMGVVYAAFDGELDRRVAIKLLLGSHDDSEQGRIVREARAMAMLAHPNVAHVYEVGHHGEHTYVAMEHVRGRTLRVWIRERPRPWRDVMAMFVQAGRGLAAAHAAGIVHRDFKPDNVVVGDDDERARVIDFGLARIDGPEDRASDDDLGTLSSPPGSSPRTKTRPGAVGGTPAYMAPEQVRGEPVDARADQFSYCVALWEALAGAPPFAGRSLGDLLDATTHGRITPAPAGTIPGWIALVLRRGLAASPADRHASMGAVLDCLQRDPTVARRRIGLGLTVVAIAAGVLGWRGFDRRRAEQACATAAGALSELWNGERTDALAAAFVDSGITYGADTWSRARPRLDAFVASWSDARGTTCVADLDTPRPASDISRTDACFAERRSHFAALLGQLEAPDAGIVLRTISSIAALPSPAACADPWGPRHDERIPAATTAELASISALHTTGRYDQALEAAKRLRADTEAAGAVAALPEIDLALGLASNRAGHYADAQAALERSFYAAGALGADETMLQAARALIDNVGYRQADVAQGLRWHALAAMLVARLQMGDHPEIAAIDNQLGLLQSVAGDYDASIAAHGRALAIRERVLGEDHPDVAGSLFNRGTMYADRGDLDLAMLDFQRSIALDEAALGPDHPNVAGTLNSLGNLHTQRGEYDAAAAVLQRSLGIKERSLGPTHASIGSTMIGLGNLHHQYGRNEEALADYRRAREVFEVALGTSHPNFAKALESEGSAMTELGRVDEGVAMMRRALAILEEALGPDHSDLAGTLHNIAATLFEAGRLDEALVLLERAKTLMEMTNPEHPDLATPLTLIANIHLTQGHRDVAILELERALTLRENAGVNSYEPSETQFLLAQALWDEGEERERARTLAQAARNKLASYGAVRADGVAAIDEWLAAHVELPRAAGALAR